MSLIIRNARKVLAFAFAVASSTLLATSLQAMKEEKVTASPLICGSHSCYYGMNYLCTNQGCHFCSSDTGYAWCS